MTAKRKLKTDTWNVKCGKSNEPSENQSNTVVIIGDCEIVRR